jgi:hypothetical protein
MPTILELIGLNLDEINPAAQGRSVMSKKEHEFIVCQKSVFREGTDSWKALFPGDSFIYKFDLGDLTCLKFQDYKFIWSSKGGHALFNLREDPNETQNIYSEADESSSFYKTKYQDWFKSLPRMKGANDTDFDNAMKEQLRGLGYME